MTSIYRDIINGTRELLSSVIDNRMNSIMKSLTVITLVMAIPTVIFRNLRYECQRALGSVCQYCARICYYHRNYGDHLCDYPASSAKEAYPLAD